MVIIEQFPSLAFDARMMAQELSTVGERIARCRHTGESRYPVFVLRVPRAGFRRAPE
jgi:hypothetical protein